MLVAAAFVVILNETTLSVALPVLMGYFEITADVAQWLVTSFMLTMAVVIPMTGYIMQRFSLRQVYAAAMLLFLAGTVLAAVAPVFPVLLGARIIQASGTALVIPLLMTTIMRLVPLERRGGVFGLVSVVIAVAPALGPTFSGLVLHSLGWRWIFILMLPLVVLALVVGLLLVRNFEEPTRPYLDVPSVFLSAVGFAATLYGMAGLSDLADGIPVARVAVMLVGIVVLAVFFARQRSLAREARAGKAAEGKRVREPLLDLAPLGERNYRLSLALMLLTFAMLFGFIILMPMFAQQVMGLSESQSGLAILPGGLAMGVMGPFVGRVYDARGTRVLTIPGSILMSAAMLGLVALGRDSSFWALTGVAVVLHIGIALLMTPLMSNALAAVPDALASHGQAILNTFQQVAAAGGTAIFIAIMTFGTQRAMNSAPGDEVGGLASGLNLAFLVGAVFSLVIVLFTVFVPLDAKKPMKAKKAQNDN
ncbi:MAG: MFS transporter [Corynebacterium urealyticum]|uniref:MFS transporter n=1 Tax=Corynebacterium urealyticum TaxID=43771 RepID=A0A2W5B7T3_9CORY|nr:MAG: MFS transporter [Corynebacterium urealyticum]